MERFDDIPDLPESASAPLARPAVDRHASPTRAEVRRRGALGVAASASWLGVQLLAFGLRGDLERIPGWYLLALIVAPITAGVAAVVLSLHPGRRGLGLRVGALTALSLLAPGAYLAAALLTPQPFAATSATLSDGAYCLDVTLALAALPLISAALVLRSSFPANAAWRSALLGAGCGLVAAGLYSLHCPFVDPAHLALGHGGAVLLSALAAGRLLSRATRA